MLKSSIQSAKSLKINECILRRRARNLRAKVRALLPVEICAKHSKRNRNVKEMGEKKGEWSQKFFKAKWQLKKQCDGQYYHECEEGINRSQRFQKLTENEIEQVTMAQLQINEDKLYYLGEDYLQDFNRYLKEKDKKSHHLLSERKNQKMNIDYPFFKVAQNCFNQANLEQGKKFQNGRDQETKYLQFIERRKMLLAEEDSKRIMNKVKLNMKIEKAEANFCSLKEKQFQILSSKKKKGEMKRQLISQRKRNCVEQGQIRKLEEKLRRTCIQRFSKSANGTQNYR